MPFQTETLAFVGPRVADEEFEDRIHDQNPFQADGASDTVDAGGLFIDWAPLACPYCGSSLCQCYSSVDAAWADLYALISKCEKYMSTSRQKTRKIRQIAREVIAKSARSHPQRSKMYAAQPLNGKHVPARAAHSSQISMAQEKA